MMPVVRSIWIVSTMSPMVSIIHDHPGQLPSVGYCWLMSHVVQMTSWTGGTKVKCLIYRQIIRLDDGKNMHEITGLLSIVVCFLQWVTATHRWFMPASSRWLPSTPVLASSAARWPSTPNGWWKPSQSRCLSVSLSTLGKFFCFTCKSCFWHFSS